MLNNTFKGTLCNYHLQNLITVMCLDVFGCVLLLFLTLTSYTYFLIEALLCCHFKKQCAPNGLVWILELQTGNTWKHRPTPVQPVSIYLQHSRNFEHEVIVTVSSQSLDGFSSFWKVWNTGINNKYNHAKQKVFTGLSEILRQTKYTASNGKYQRAEVSVVWWSGVFRCLLTQCHSLPRSRHPS